MHEEFFDCPYCGAPISVLLDVSVSQTYVEDCEVCCRPLQISYTAEDGELTSFSAESAAS